MSGFDICPKCPKGSRPVKLIGGTCYAHFVNPKEEITRNVSPKVAKAKEEKDTDKELKEWYDMQIAIIPKCCENCGAKITIRTRTAVAHVLKKSKFKSVRTHILNRWFGCWQCHHDYDEKPEEEVKTMPIVKICRQRFQAFKDKLTTVEERRLPEWIKEPI